MSQLGKPHLKAYAYSGAWKEKNNPNQVAPPLSYTF